MSPLTAVDPVAAAQVQHAFAELIGADPDLIRAEFDAIIEANWDCLDPPPVADDGDLAPESRPNPWVQPGTPYSTGSTDDGPSHASGWARLRSPPDQRTLPAALT